MSLINFNETYKPFIYPWAVKLAEEHESIHWIEGEIDLGEDVEQWMKGGVTEIEKNHITQILRLFTQTDTQVGQNYCDLFIPYFKNNEIRMMLLAFASREGIHQRAYSLLNDTLGLPESDYKAFLEYEEMVTKIEFMQKNSMSSPFDVGLSLAQSTCNEGMSLFSAFVMLLNYQRFGKMKGLVKISEWSLRDESQHVEGMSKLFRTYCVENPAIVNDYFKQNIYQMFRDAVRLEDKFIDLVYEMGEPEGLTKEEVKEYIRYIANRRLTMLGLKPNWENVSKNPLPWLDWILKEGHTNFFEQRVSEYNASGMQGSWGR